MYDVCHPSFYKIGELGCQDVLQISTAFNAYIELCEVRKLWNVEYKYEPVINTIYLTAKLSNVAETQIYVPWPVKKTIKLHDIERLQKQLNCNRFTLVLKSGESSSIFYDIRQGLIKPDATLRNTEKMHSISQKKNELNKTLKRNSHNLYRLVKIQK
ncbi:hypothetical protein HCN44_004798 [Aphidius gifuensis]|uniref:tRNA-splicing endonuclease subunit Sen15 domain-containing protein n=1 Tax=Aphidius gifuensis TaxID=684658 RepID=A0A834XLY0_APHGI|nr:uncharacterized protein LOC122859584 [Aphidius gifuensis]KAF7987982.1 hypothetical protein HCN44_004798 [Aphidius gifuensis]